MQWKSLLLCAAIAESALARTHGHQRRQHGHGHAQEAHVAARDVEVEVHTVVNIEHVTLTTTVYGQPTEAAEATTSTTAEAAATTDAGAFEVSASDAWQYKYVIRMEGSNTKDWFVSFWNKIGPDGKMDGWYGHSALNFTLAAGETKYVAFDENSQGGWGAAEGDSLPTDDYGGYSCTWGEFDFGDTDNSGWSGWDVSAIQAQNADQTVQGMRICQYSDKQCSYITTDAETVVNAYTASEASVDGIGGTVSSGAVRLTVEVDYS
ncbi:hypothetical protein CAN33_0022655 [Aspergillus niger]|uniref:Allergen Asp f 4 n=1 Tax=Aspergillus niger TaxID=5061 RepID=A0A505IGB9_ASPNG|nr:hypothetical protein CAN33_0022655 [Aspergillus niger]